MGASLRVLDLKYCDQLVEHERGVERSDASWNFVVAASPFRLDTKERTTQLKSVTSLNAQPLKAPRGFSCA